MTGSPLTFWAATVVAGVMALVVVYVALRWHPGVVSLSPPEGSPRWPVYGFFIPWFAAGLTASSSGGRYRPLLWIRLAMFLIVIAAMAISWWRLRRNPVTPPRV